MIIMLKHQTNCHAKGFLKMGGAFAQPLLQWKSNKHYIF
jgi:hypothetical protein